MDNIVDASMDDPKFLTYLETSWPLGIQPDGNGDMIRLTFLGTKAEVEIPQEGHDDPQCKEARRLGDGYTTVSIPPCWWS